MYLIEWFQCEYQHFADSFCLSHISPSAVAQQQPLTQDGLNYIDLLYESLPYGVGKESSS